MTRMIGSFSFLILMTIFSHASAALNQQQAFMRQFQSSRVQFADENSPFAGKSQGQYPALLKFLFQNVLSWSPTGEGKPLSAKCSPELWGTRLRDPRMRSSVQLQGALIQKYLKDCGSELETGYRSPLASMTKMMTMEYHPQEHPFLHRVVFHLPGNIKLKGLLGLKGDFKKRPLVILRLGIFANVEEFMPERAWLMMLFEQAPFNVLLLENMSGTDFVENNSRFSFGGYDEGIQNILVAQILRDPNEPLSRLIESLHLFGVSLGGHGVFYASLLNDLNSPKGQSLYQSFMGFCPVVNLEETMDGVTSNKPFALAVDLWSQKRLSRLEQKMPALQDHENFAFLKKTVSEVVRTYHGGLSYVASVKLPPGVTDGAEFWELNDFWKNYKDVKKPVLVLANHADLLVRYDLNSELLQNKSMKVDSNNLSVVDFEHGIHCTLPVSYDWKAISTLLQSYVLSHSPNFKLREQSLELELGDESSREFYKDPLVLNYRVQKPKPTENFARVAVEFENKKGQTESLKLNLPLAQFDFHFFNGEMSESEQAMVQRWMNQNLSLKLLSRGEQRPVLKVSWPLAN